MLQDGYLILGYGYVGEALEEHLKTFNPSAKIFKTSRDNKKDFIQFDLSDPDTWINLPAVKNVFWTFPPEPREQIASFISFLNEKCERLVVVGTTGSLLVETKDQLVDETTKFDFSNQRAKAEWELVQSGCRLVLSAGIYGPGRSPLSWVKSGRIGKNSKYVNMIHINDLVRVLLAALNAGKNGQVYIASDGCPQKWEDIISFWERKGLVKDIPEKSSQRLSKRIDSQKTRDELNLDLEFRNFQEAVFLMSQPS